jgi:20S proteasome alpha/beta subunit
VTVCVAAMCRDMLVGASDRMLTAGDVEFEPNQAKVWTFSRSIVALVAGDATIQGELLLEVSKEVQQWINSEPNNWVNVKDVASLYCKQYRTLLRKHAEAEILHPLGLDIPSFLTTQTKMRRELIEDIVQKLTTFDFPSIQETIFMGIDNDGPTGAGGEKLVCPPLFATYGSKLSWMNAVGFVAIGGGKIHAESQFMFAGHSQHKNYEDTIQLTLAAKKRAEVAPGVGKLTDMVVIGPGLGTFTTVEEENVKELETIYQEAKLATDKAIESAQTKTKQFIDRLKREQKKQKEKQAKEQSQKKPTAKPKPSTSQKSEQAP